MKRRAALTLALLLASATATAGWNQGRGQDVKPARDESWRKSDGPFGAMLVVTDRLDSFLAEWAKPDDPSHPPTIKPARSAKRGDVVWGIVVFHQCSADASGRCNAEADFTVLRPDGGVYATHAGADVWHEAPLPKGRLQLANARLGFRIEKTDPLGTYTIRAVVMDHAAKRSVTLESTLDVRAPTSR